MTLCQVLILGITSERRDSPRQRTARRGRGSPRVPRRDRRALNGLLGDTRGRLRLRWVLRLLALRHALRAQPLFPDPVAVRVPLAVGLAIVRERNARSASTIVSMLVR